jgi:hypothetical protein
MIVHRYENMLKRSDEEVEDFIINNPYECYVIMTNISPQGKDFTLMYQIPNGSIPLR